MNDGLLWSLSSRESNGFFNRDERCEEIIVLVVIPRHTLNWFSEFRLEFGLWLHSAGGDDFFDFLGFDLSFGPFLVKNRKMTLTPWTAFGEPVNEDSARAPRPGG